MCSKLKPRLSTYYVVDRENDISNSSEIYRLADEEWNKLQCKQNDRRKSTDKRQSIFDNIREEIKPYISRSITERVFNKNLPIHASTPVSKEYYHKKPPDFNSAISNITSSSSEKSDCNQIKPNEVITRSNANVNIGSSPKSNGKNDNLSSTLTNINDKDNVLMDKFLRSIKLQSVSMQTSFPYKESVANGPSKEIPTESDVTITESRLSKRDVSRRSSHRFDNKSVNTSNKRLTRSATRNSSAIADVAISKEKNRSCHSIRTTQDGENISPKTLKNTMKDISQNKSHCDDKTVHSITHSRNEETDATKISTVTETLKIAKSANSSKKSQNSTKSSHEKSKCKPSRNSQTVGSADESEYDDGSDVSDAKIEDRRSVSRTGTKNSLMKRQRKQSWLKFSRAADSTDSASPFVSNKSRYRRKKSGNVTKRSENEDARSPRTDLHAKATDVCDISKRNVSKGSEYDGKSIDKKLEKTSDSINDEKDKMLQSPQALSKSKSNKSRQLNDSNVLPKNPDVTDSYDQITLKDVAIYDDADAPDLAVQILNRLSKSAIMDKNDFDNENPNFKTPNNKTYAGPQDVRNEIKRSYSQSKSSQNPVPCRPTGLCSPVESGIGYSCPESSETGYSNCFVVPKIINVRNEINRNEKKTAEIPPHEDQVIIVHNDVILKRADTEQENCISDNLFKIPSGVSQICDNVLPKNENNPDITLAIMSIVNVLSNLSLSNNPTIIEKFLNLMSTLVAHLCQKNPNESQKVIDLMSKQLDASKNTPVHHKDHSKSDSRNDSSNKIEGLLADTLTHNADKNVARESACTSKTPMMVDKSIQSHRLCTTIDNTNSTTDGQPTCQICHKKVNKMNDSTSVCRECLGSFSSFFKPGSVSKLEFFPTTLSSISCNDYHQSSRPSNQLGKASPVYLLQNITKSPNLSNRVDIRDDIIAKNGTNAKAKSKTEILSVRPRKSMATSPIVFKNNSVILNTETASNSADSPKLLYKSVGTSPIIFEEDHQSPKNYRSPLRTVPDSTFKENSVGFSEKPSAKISLPIKSLRRSKRMSKNQRNLSKQLLPSKTPARNRNKSIEDEANKSLQLIVLRTSPKKRKSLSSRNMAAKKRLFLFDQDLTQENEEDLDVDYDVVFQEMQLRLDNEDGLKQFNSVDEPEINCSKEYISDNQDPREPSEEISSSRINSKRKYLPNMQEIINDWESKVGGSLLEPSSIYTEVPECLKNTTHSKSKTPTEKPNRIEKVIDDSVKEPRYSLRKRSQNQGEKKNDGNQGKNLVTVHDADISTKKRRGASKAVGKKNKSKKVEMETSNIFENTTNQEENLFIVPGTSDVPKRSRGARKASTKKYKKEMEIDILNILQNSTIYDNNNLRRTGRKREPPRILRYKSVYDMDQKDVDNHLDRILISPIESIKVLIERGLLSADMISMPKIKKNNITKKQSTRATMTSLPFREDDKNI